VRGFANDVRAAGLEEVPAFLEIIYPSTGQVPGKRGPADTDPAYWIGMDVAFEKTAVVGVGKTTMPSGMSLPVATLVGNSKSTS